MIFQISTNRLTPKQRLGAWFIPKVPITSHVFNHIRLELNAFRINLANRFNPKMKATIEHLSRQEDLLANIGCGPFGRADWINLDIYPHNNVTLAADTRKSLPLAERTCSGIHVEHFLEHLHPTEERPYFLQDCFRCLQKDGILRIVVPDAEIYIRAYLEDGWKILNEVGCGSDKPEQVFKTKMQALNHVFLQDWEHYGGYDFETLSMELKAAGFSKVNRVQWSKGDFPKGCIDREQHKRYSLYVEAKR